MSDTHELARMPSGIDALDGAIEGGLPRYRLTLITCDVGAGKTTLAMQFLAEGARLGQPGIFIAIDQKPLHVVESAARFKWPIGTDPASPVLVLDGSPALWGALEMGLTDACRAGAKELVSMWGHPDQEEGPRAFAEKREPQWKELS